MVVERATRTPAQMVALLTAQELDCIRLACRYPKPTPAEIAEYIGISPKTVDKHIHKVYKKLGVQCHADMYHVAVALGVVKCQCQRMAGWGGGAGHGEDGITSKEAG